MQKNWIGKSFGVEINFEILQPEGNKKIKIFSLLHAQTLYLEQHLAIVRS